jgi:oligopeptidase A
MSESTTSDTQNPLLNIGFALPFHTVNPSHIQPAVKQLLEQAERALQAIENVPGVRTYANTMHAYDYATEPLERAMGMVRHLESVASTSELREAHNAVRPDVSSFYAGIPLREKLYAALGAFAKTAEAKALTGAKARYLKKTLDDFRKSGAELDEAGKDRLRAISREMADLTSKFSQHVVDATSAFELLIEDEADLAGLPPSAVDAARADAEAKGKTGFRFTLQGPSVVAVLTYLDKRDIREKLWLAYNTRAAAGELNNEPLILKILALRTEQAKLLGYADFPTMVLEDRMAQKAQTALDFIKTLHAKTDAAFRKEARELEAFKDETNPGGPTLAPWDVGYYSEKQRKALYDFDEEELRPYFSLNNVMAGLFETAKRLYRVGIVPNTTLPTWHEDVTAYDIRDESGELLASFYADIFPREEKRGGAWMNSFITGTLAAGKLSPHLGLICTNATPPIGNKPALLTHSEVSTMFHEFGHLLHHCLSRVEVRALAGTNVAWDFVELPSQIMENWCWEKEALNTFAKHCETGELIPDTLFDKLVRARTYRAASMMMRQLGFAALDMAIHLEYQPARDGALLAYARDVMQAYAPTPYPENYAMLASFTHLFSDSVGYAAGYYSYKWAEVLDADAFTRFKGAGVFSAEVGDAFRRSILECGDTEDPMDLYKRFMGREPSLDPLLERFGLLTPQAAE